MPFKLLTFLYLIFFFIHMSTFVANLLPVNARSHRPHSLQFSCSPLSPYFSCLRWPVASNLGPKRLLSWNIVAGYKFDKLYWFKLRQRSISPQVDVSHTLNTISFSSRCAHRRICYPQKIDPSKRKSCAEQLIT